MEHSLLAREVPLRGAIAHGAFARSEDNSNDTVVAGRPTIETHYDEAQLQWVGVILAPSILRQVPDLPSRGIIHGPRGDEDRETYFSRLEGFAVVPLSDSARSPDALQQCMSDNLAKRRWLKQLATDSRSQAKYQNTIAWLEPLYHQWIARHR